MQVAPCARKRPACALIPPPGPVLRQPSANAPYVRLTMIATACWLEISPSAVGCGFGTRKPLSLLSALATALW